MIADLSGSLSSLSRHDYLPFGEELYAGTGGRTTAQGYSASDNVRQHFTQYERDNETGLDYANARYYANFAGRFTSVDPAMGSAKPAMPQSWNRYSYCINSPLVLVDPSGLIWGSKYDDKTHITTYEWFTGDKVGAGYTKVTSFYVEGLIDGRRVGLHLNPEGPNSFLVTTLRGLSLGAYLTVRPGDYYTKGYEITRTREDEAFFMKSGSVADDPVGNALLGGAFRGAFGAVEAGLGSFTGPSVRAMAGGGDGVATPYGTAVQSTSAEALAAREAVENGATLYRGGMLGRSAGPEGQFWSLENPLSPGYAQRYGIPSGNSNFNFIEYGRLRPGSPFITRPAPGAGPNAGIETVVRPNGVRLSGFHSP